MTARRRRRTAALLAAALLALLGAGCGSPDTPKESRMSIDDANDELTRIAGKVMDVLSPDEQVDLPDGPPSPCGGLGGNEFDKIRYGLNLQGSPTDPELALARVTQVLRAEGYTVNDPDTMGGSTSVTFTGEMVSGDLTVPASGPVAFGAQTECLRNPDGRR